MPLLSRLAWASALASITCALVATAATAADGSRKPARAATNCWSGYSYAGVQNPSAAYGVSASLSLVNLPSVASGHVAAWVGVGGAGLGPGGSDVWLQVGIARDAGGADELYYEVKRPGDEHAQYVSLGPAYLRDAHKVAVVERRGMRDSWQVFVDGSRVGPAYTLPGSHGKFQPVATAESWDGGQRSCNGYAFDFSELAVATQPGRAWQPFQLARVLRDPAYTLALRASGFTASSR